MNQDTETARLMAIKATLVTTTNTPGWSYIKQIAGNVVQRAVNDALDEEDSAKGETKRLKASALKKGFADLFNAIETTTAFAASTDESIDFESLDFETAVTQ